MKKLRDNGLTIALLLLFLGSIIGHTLAGWNVTNEENADRNEPQQSLPEYLKSGEYIESVFENWESEFLQMGMYVILTAMLFQRGSPESRDPDGEEDTKLESGETPWAAKRGGAIRWLYAHSLAIALLTLFAASLLLHAYGGVQAYNNDQKFFHKPAITMAEYLHSSRFWFESFQNWQSEFLSIAMLVVLAIYLRQERSPQSKPVDAPHSQTRE